MSDRILGDLNQHTVSSFERRLNFPRASNTRFLCRVPINFTRIQHSVTAAPDVDESGFHAGQNILNPTQIDVADQARFF